MTTRARTKIVCTVGPACEQAKTLEALVGAGASVFRINGAHTPIEDLPRWVRRIRAAGRAAGEHVAALVDLPGTKIRVGRFVGTDSIELAEGQEVTFYPGRTGGSPTRIPLYQWPKLERLVPGARILLADGQIRLETLSAARDAVRAEVVHGGPLQAGKGAAFPGARLLTQVPTTRDRRIARAAIAAGVDWLALSFVSSFDDVERLKRLVAREGVPDLCVLAKIEREDAVERLDSILVRATGAMVARGDLGVDVGPERVPMLQRRILDAGRRRGRMVVVATEMLESMVDRPRPTRAEANDVAHAVFQGADSVMLSAETAVGRHPVTVVETMNRILVAAESSPDAPYAGRSALDPPESLPGRFDQHVVHASVLLAERTRARGIVVFTRTGASALRLAKERPSAPILAFAPRDTILRRIAPAWGVRPHRLPAGRNSDELVARVADHLRQREQWPAGSRAVLVMGGAKDPAGATTMIRVLTV